MALKKALKFFALSTLLLPLLAMKGKTLCVQMLEGSDALFVETLTSEVSTQNQSVAKEFHNAQEALIHFQVMINQRRVFTASPDRSSRFSRVLDSAMNRFLPNYRRGDHLSHLFYLSARIIPTTNADWAFVRFLLDDSNTKKGSEFADRVLSTLGSRKIFIFVSRTKGPSDLYVEFDSQEATLVSARLGLFNRGLAVLVPYSSMEIEFNKELPELNPGATVLSALENYPKPNTATDDVEGILGVKLSILFPLRSTGDSDNYASEALYLMGYRFSTVPDVYDRFFQKVQEARSLKDALVLKAMAAYNLVFVDPRYETPRLPTGLMSRNVFEENYPAGKAYPRRSNGANYGLEYLSGQLENLGYRWNEETLDWMPAPIQP